MSTTSPRNKALEALSQRDRDSLVSYFVRREAAYGGLSQADVEDAVSDAIAKLLMDDHKTFDASRPVGGLVHYVARNLLRDRVRAQKAQPELISIDDGFGEHLQAPGTSTLSDTYEWRYKRRLSLAMLYQIREKLSADEKVVLDMRVNESAKHAEIGKRLGKSAEAARKEWARIQVRLRKMIEEKFVELGWEHLGQTPTPEDELLIDRYFEPDCTTDEIDRLHSRLKSSEPFAAYFGDELMVRMVATVGSVA